MRKYEIIIERNNEKKTLLETVDYNDAEKIYKQAKRIYKGLNVNIAFLSLEYKLVSTTPIFREDV